MKKFVWCTDIHLDFVDNPESPGWIEKNFAQPIADQQPDGVFITGDISLASDIVRHLKILHGVIKRPIYYVCGNHDFYDGSIRGVREQLSQLARENDAIKYMSASPFISLTKSTALVGHDGWYDAYHGDFSRSNVVMSDWFKIHDFVNAGVLTTGMYGPRPNFSVAAGLARSIASEAAEHVLDNASKAAKSHGTVIILTHVPPFPEAHTHDGKGASMSALPWYTSRLMGNCLQQVAQENPGTRFEVFCGHTHGSCDVQISHNLFCHVGGAEYGSPRWQGLVQVR